MSQDGQQAAPAMVAEREPVAPTQRTDYGAEVVEREGHLQADGQDDHVYGSNEDGSHSDGANHAEGAQGVVVTDPADLPKEEKKKKKKKKKKRKPASKRGLVSAV